MAHIKPFCGVRAPKDLVQQVTAKPYDVLSSEEARTEAAGNEMSLYHITKPEINFPSGTDEHDPRVYDSAKEQYSLFQRNGWLQRDSKECYYVYAQTMNGKTQHGLVVAASAEDYEKGVILRHELTRRDKEDDRMRHVRACNANLGPAFFAYRHRDDLKAIISNVCKADAEYDFSCDGIRHQMWPICDDAVVNDITKIFADIDKLYIADGHHRSAAAVRVAQERRTENAAHNGTEEYNYFLAVCFPEDELTILDYNRLLKDLNGMTKDELLAKLSQDFEVQETEHPRPQKKHDFALYIEQKWYRLHLKNGLADENDPIESLDVAISSHLILDNLFGIKDLRGDKRIEFVGGIRGLNELKKRVDNGDAACALALYPTTMEEIFRVADSGNIMPPKATWFEPKLRSGVVIHELD